MKDKKYNKIKNGKSKTNILDNNLNFYINSDLVYNVKEKDNYNNFFKHAEEFAKNNKESPNQIRKIYDEILKINENNMNKNLAFLKVKLAYAFGKKNIKKGFYNCMKKLIENVKSKEDLEIFKDFMEAFVAYNKVYGEDKNKTNKTNKNNKNKKKR